MRNVFFILLGLSVVFAPFAFGADETPARISPAVSAHQPAIPLDAGFQSFGHVPTGTAHVYSGDASDEIRESPGVELSVTFRDMQNNASLGHQIAIDSQGGIHMIWMQRNSDDDAALTDVRYTYNDGTGDTMDPNTWLAPASVQGGDFSGYNVIDMKATEDIPVVTYHHAFGGDSQTQVAWDIITGFGAFAFSFVDLQSYPGRTIIWPKAAVGSNDVVHVLAQDNPDSPAISTIFGSRSNTGDYNEGFQLWDLLDETVNRSRLLSYAVDASKTSQKVVRAFLLGRDNTDTNNSLSHQVECDVYFQVSTDAGTTWGEMQNLTNYDWDLNGPSVVDPTNAEFDSLFWRAGYTVEVHVDNDDVAHVMWSAIMKTLPDDNSEYGYTYDLSQVMHWDDQREVMDVVYNDWLTNPILDSAYAAWDRGEISGVNTGISDWTGAFRSTSCVPTMGNDDDGNLYMTFVKFFADDYCTTDDSYQNDSAGHMYNGEIMAIASTDGGASWGTPDGMGVPVNLTNSHTPDCEVGECDDDTNPTIAKKIHDGTMHLFFLVDRAPGRYFDESPLTANSVRYLPVAAADVLPTGSAIEDDDDTVTGKSSFLSQNSPNPFTGQTTIHFSLANPANVDVAIYNEAGQRVKTFDRVYRQAGNHELVWDGTNDRGDAVSTGVYFYRVRANDQVESKRMVLLR